MFSLLFHVSHHFSVEDFFFLAGILIAVVQKSRGNTITMKIHVSIKIIQALKLEVFYPRNFLLPSFFLFFLFLHPHEFEISGSWSISGKERKALNPEDFAIWKSHLPSSSN